MMDDGIGRCRDTDATTLAEGRAPMAGTDLFQWPTAAVEALHERLGFARAYDPPPASLGKALIDWKMPTDDAPILRYLHRNLQPQRHLEFGTWEGAGALCCLEESEATVWTLNLPDGETWPNGNYAYPRKHDDKASVPLWANKRVSGGQTLYQTDAGGFIGRLYRDKGLGHRVCQIYCDSRDWDTSNYPEGFFDSALIDGGHTEEVVTSDTRKAFHLVRPGGLIVWHDFCPDPRVYEQCSSVRGVMDAVGSDWPWISQRVADIFWVRPSWLLVGVKAPGTKSTTG